MIPYNQSHPKPMRNCLNMVVILFVPLMAWGLPCAVIADGRAPASGQGAKAAKDKILDEFIRRANASDLNNIDHLMKLGKWAEGNGLIWKAADIYHRVLRLNEKHDEAYTRWSNIAQNNRLPKDVKYQKKVLAELRKFRSDLKLHVGSHFLVVYNTDRNWAINRAVLLEETHHTFFSTFRQARQRPWPLKKRLVCVLLDDQKTFVEYAKKIDKADMSWASGYYSSRTNRIVFFNDVTAPAFKKVVDHIAKRKRQLDAIRQTIRRGVGDNDRYKKLVAQRNVVQKELNFYRNRLKAIANITNSSKTTHEAVHQLSFNTNIQRRSAPDPFWLSEGLATNYEAETPSTKFGPYRPNRERRFQLKKFYKDNKLIKMREFVVMVRVPPKIKNDKILAMYAQAYGLFNYLFRKKRDELNLYMSKLRNKKPAVPKPNEMIKEFEAAFGPVSDVERAFKQYIRLMP